MGRDLSPRYLQIYWSADTLFWQLSIDHNIDVQVARNCESKHWFACGADGRRSVGVRSRDYQIFDYQIFWDG